MKTAYDMRSVDGVFRFIAYLMEWTFRCDSTILLIFGNRKLEINIEEVTDASS
jgi:hypothetical protein